MDEQNNFPNVDPKDFKETDAYMETQVPGDRSLEAEVNEPAPQGDQSDTEILERMSQKGYDVSQYGSDQEFISDTEAKYSQNAIDYAQAGYEQQRYLEQRATAGPDPDLAAQQKSEGGMYPNLTRHGRIWLKMTGMVGMWFVLNISEALILLLLTE